jgi:hypothetical protein
MSTERSIKSTSLSGPFNPSTGAALRSEGLLRIHGYVGEVELGAKTYPTMDSAKLA